VSHVGVAVIVAVLRPCVDGLFGTAAEVNKTGLKRVRGTKPVPRCPTSQVGSVGHRQDT